MATIDDLEQRLAELEARIGGPAPLAVAPITIGELTDVPAPGSPIASQWAQEVTHRIAQRFATTAARDAWTGAAVGSVCYVTGINSLQMKEAGGWVVVAEQSQAWAPTWQSGVTPGAGTYAQSFQRCNGWAEFWLRFTLGSGSGITGPPKLNLPVAAGVIAPDQFTVSMIRAADSGIGIGSHDDAPAPTLYLVKTDLATAGVTNIGPSSPWAWATGDRLFVYGKYQMASRYS